MKNCPNRGNATEDSNNFCPNCGTRLTTEKTETEGKDSAIEKTDAVERDSVHNSTEEKASVVTRVLAFFFPLIGFILFLAWSDSSKRKSKDSGKFALIGLCVEILLPVVVVGLLSLIKFRF